MKSHRHPELAPPGPSRSKGTDLGSGDQDLIGNAALLEQLGAPQEDPGTLGGTWSTSTYAAHEVTRDGITSKGCTIALHFAPDSLVDAEEIVLVQTCRGVSQAEAGAPDQLEFLGDPERERRATTEADGEAGWHIDSGGGDLSPVYGVDIHEEGGSLADFGADSRVNHGPGRSTLVDGVATREPAWLTDTPKQIWTPGKSFTLSFETAALCTRGAQEGTWYGSVSWGCTVDAAGGVHLEDLDVAAPAMPTATFQAASKRWNDDTATVTPDQDPALTEATARPTIDLPLDTPQASLDSPDRAMQLRAIRLEGTELAQEQLRLKTERITFARANGSTLGKEIGAEAWKALLHDRFDRPLAQLEAELVALRARRAALGDE